LVLGSKAQEQFWPDVLYDANDILYRSETPAVQVRYWLLGNCIY